MRVHRKDDETLVLSGAFQKFAARSGSGDYPAR